MLRIMPLALATAATLSLAACGDAREETTTTAAPGVSVAPAVASGPESTTTITETPVLSVPPNVTFEEAESTYYRKRYAEAAAMFDAYVQRRPDNPWGHYMLGLSAWKAGDLDRARSALEASIELDPKHVKSRVNLSRVLLDRGEPREALEQAAAALALDSGTADVHRVMGRARAELGRREDALESYRTALALEPDDAWSMNNMGLVLIRLGRYEEALGPLARAVQLGDAAVFHNNLGIALERTGHHAMAAESYRAALSVDGGYAKAAQSLARVEGRVDDPSAPPVEIATLGDDFAEQVQRWREERLAVVGAGVAGRP